MGYIMCRAWVRSSKMPQCKCGIAMKSNSILQFNYGSTHIYVYQLFYLAINKQEIFFKKKH